MPHTPRRSDVDSIRAENTANAKTIAALQKQLEEALAVPSGLPVVAGTSELKEAAREKLVTQAREELIATQRVVKLAQDGLNTVLPAAPPTSRAGHLRSLPELIGPPPPNRTWEDEWVKLKAESYRLSGQGEATVEEDEAYVRENDPIEKYVAQDGVQSDIAYLVEQGWPSDNAKVYALLFTCLDALARALSERDSCYAASTYAISETLFAQRYGGAPEMQPGDAATARQVLASMRTSRAPAAAAPMRRRSATYNQLPPAMYTNLNGLFSLASRDPQWEEIETPDGTGFRGLTSAALVHATFEPQNFTEEGFMVNTTDPNDPTKAVLEVQDSDIVCFRSDKDDELGAHSAILTSDSSGDFPPNTLFRLQGGYEAGEWEAPGGVFPMQRLLVVTATYQPPRAGITGIAQDNGGSKMCGTSNLLYNKREDFLKGLDDLIAKPAMTMKNEFARDDSWTDWQGVKYTAGKEWEYVNGPAKRMEGCTPGTRDEANNGKTPQDFLDKINDFIAQRRAENYGTMLTDEHAFLKLEEVLAVRLYTGPAYQPINAFLRQISTLHDVKFRNEVALHPGLTYAATVGHICRAIRKLAAVATDEEAAKPLWRGVRGELNKAFWLPDEQGMVCAVDMAFLSTSRLRTAPIDYMDPTGKNVLWELHAIPESDSGFHRGADIDMLSQFAGEAECLFPPCTMLIVKEQTKIAAARRAGDWTRVKSLMEKNKAHATYGHFSAKEETVSGKTFLAIDVLPTFL